MVEDVWKAWSNVIKGRALYQSMMLRLSDLFRAKCVQSTTLITGAPTPRLTSQCMLAKSHGSNGSNGR